MADALYGPSGFYTSGRARPGAVATSSPRRRSVRCSAPSWPASSMPSGSGSGDPTRSRSSTPAPGPGALARSVLAADPACCRGRCGTSRVEVSAAQRALHPAGVESAPISPAGPFDGVIIANELLDNLPFRLAVHDGGWREAYVVGSPDGRLVEIAERSRSTRCPTVLPAQAALGARAPLQDAARDWVERRPRAACATARCVVIDYIGRRRRPSSPAGRGASGCARTARHERGDHYLADPGAQDITTEVAIDQLPAPDAIRTQAQWLQLHGIGELVEEGRRHWEAHAARPDLEAMRMRSRGREARRCSIRRGLGGFTVLEYSALELSRADVPAGHGRVLSFTDRRSSMSEQPHDTIDALMAENRRFPPPDSFKDAGAGRRHLPVRRGCRATTRASGRARPRTWCSGRSRGTRSSNGSCRSPSGSSAAKLNVSENCLDRHVARRPGRQGRDPLGGRAGRHADDHLRRTARRGVQVRQRPQEHRRRARAIGSTSTSR